MSCKSICISLLHMSISSARPWMLLGWGRCLFSLLFLFLLWQFPSIKFESFTQFSSVQSLSRVRLFVTPWIAAHQASLSITNSWSPPKPMSIVSVMPSNHLILHHSLLLLPPIFPSIRVFSNESALCIRRPWLIYLFIMAVLDLGCITQGLQCCLWAFSTRGEWELLSSLWYAGLSLQWLLVSECRL